jgi:formate hydrogenlyase subunit 3/multisubunit Na+/H+ antiporter MnhD subunit
MVAAGFIAKLATKIGWKGFAMGSVGGLAGLITGSALTGGGGGGGPLGGITSALNNLGSLTWIILGLGIAAVAIYIMKGVNPSRRR